MEKFGPPIAKVIGDIGKVFGAAFGIIADVVGVVFNTLTGLLDFVIGRLQVTGREPWERCVKNIFKGIWDGIYSIVKGIINLIIDGLNLLWGRRIQSSKRSS